MEKLHLITQRNQPIGSIRKCCERCGLMIRENFAYVDDEKDYTKEVSEEAGYVRCVDDTYY